MAKARAPQKKSAGLLMFRRPATGLEVLLVHPGGPFFAKKDAGVWTIPKGLLEPGEDELQAARREFTEETSFSTPEPGEGVYWPLGEIRQRGGKCVTAWAFEGEADAEGLVSNRFEMEWPPRSGRTQSFPEVDRALWLDPEGACRQMHPDQVPLLERLIERVLEHP